MDSKSILVVILASILSGILGVLISNIYHHKNQDRQIKIDTFKRVFSNRYDLQGEDFSKAVNEIFVIYNDSGDVMKKLDSFHRAVVAKQGTENALLNLLKSMCKEVNINYNDFNDSFFLTPFNTKPSSMKPIG